jgi:hypothetical protein
MTGSTPGISVRVLMILPYGASGGLIIKWNGHLMLLKGNFPDGEINTVGLRCA